jgi:hypothetical protein
VYTLLLDFLLLAARIAAVHHYHYYYHLMLLGEASTLLGAFRFLLFSWSVVCEVQLWIRIKSCNWADYLRIQIQLEFYCEPCVNRESLETLSELVVQPSFTWWTWFGVYRDVNPYPSCVKRDACHLSASPKCVELASRLYSLWLTIIRTFRFLCSI